MRSIRFSSLALLVFSLCLAFTEIARAQAQKIGIIDIDRLLAESEFGKKAQVELKAMRDQREAQVKAKAKEAQDLRAKLSDPGRSAASQDELETKLRNEERNLRRLEEDAGRELAKKREELLADLDRKAMPLINQVGKEQKFSLIFRKFQSGLIYADETVDITALVIERLNQEAKRR